MLSAKPDPNYAGGNASHPLPALNQPKNPWQRNLFVAAENSLHQIILDEDLHALCHARRELASQLHALKIRKRGSIARQTLGDNIGSSHGVLNCEIYSHPANRRHRVRSISNDQESWPK